MYVLIQRVTRASVVVSNENIAEIKSGILAFVGFEKGDAIVTLNKMAEKLLGYRVFSDHDGKMNLNIKDINGDILLVPQFTLAADTKKGLRPSFSSALSPDEATSKFDDFVSIVKGSYEVGLVLTGKFGADMKVSLLNDGPVTFMLHVSAEK